MRDKVKRFISILMTALMLVNLMPVGALADGITSIGYKPEVAASTGNYTVYVYARFDGDPLPGVTLNASQWYTIGYIKDVNLPSPGGTSWGQYWYYNNNNYCGSTINSTSASGIIGGLVQEYNTSIVIKSDEWISANFKACPGADTYKPHTSEPTWHLDIIVDINKNPPVHNLVFKVNNSNGKQIGTPKKVTGRWTNPLSFNTYTKGNPVPDTIIDGGIIYKLKERWEGNQNLYPTKIYFNEPIKNVEFYYKEVGPVTRDYTVNYYLNGTEEKVKTSTTGTKELGETVTPDTNVTGYTLVPGQETSLTIVDGNMVRVMTKEEIPKMEPELLKIAKSSMACLKLPQVDVLIVDRIGKDISGEGMDPNIAGRWIVPTIQGGIQASRIGILDITDKTLGNVVGLGMADTCSKRVVERMSRENTYPNSLTSTVTCLCKIPMYFDTQKETIQATIKMTPGKAPEEITMIRIRDTLAMDTIWVSENLLPTIRGMRDMEILGLPEELAFDENDDLLTSV